MAKRIYDDEKIRAIAKKIRSFVPSLHLDRFTTEEMPDAVQRVYEEGESSGKKKGYSDGYNTGYSKGHDDGNRTGYSKGQKEGYNKGILDGYEIGGEMLKTEEARTSDDVTVEGSLVTVSSGYYAKSVEKEIDQGVELPELSNPGTAEDMLAGKQLIDGEGNVVTGTIVTRTRDDLTLSSASTVAVPPGYYAEKAEKTINTETFYNSGYNEGYKDGWGIGYSEGHNEGINDGYDIGYDDGRNSYENGNGVYY